MGDGHYRAATHAEGLTEAQRAFLREHGADDARIDAWLRGELPNAQAAAMEAPGDDLSLPILGAVAVLGSPVPLYAWHEGARWAVIATGVYALAVIAALAWRFAVPAARRLGFGPVERLAVTVSFGQRSETDEDGNTRTWKTLRWQSASGEFEETVHGQKALEALAARGSSVRCQLFRVRRRGRSQVLGITPDA